MFYLDWFYSCFQEILNKGQDAGEPLWTEVVNCFNIRNPQMLYNIVVQDYTPCSALHEERVVTKNMTGQISRNWMSGYKTWLMNTDKVPPKALEDPRKVYKGRHNYIKKRNMKSIAKNEWNEECVPAAHLTGNERTAYFLLGLAPGSWSTTMPGFLEDSEHLIKIANFISDGELNPESWNPRLNLDQSISILPEKLDVMVLTMKEMNGGLNTVKKMGKNATQVYQVEEDSLVAKVSSW